MNLSDALQIVLDRYENGDTRRDPESDAAVAYLRAYRPSDPTSRDVERFAVRARFEDDESALCRRECHALCAVAPGDCACECHR